MSSAASELHGQPQRARLCCQCWLLITKASLISFVFGSVVANRCFSLEAAAGFTSNTHFTICTDVCVCLGWAQFLVVFIKPCKLWWNIFTVHTRVYNACACVLLLQYSWSHMCFEESRLFIPSKWTESLSHLIIISPLAASLCFYGRITIWT